MDASPSASIDIIVPVRGAGPVFARCAASLARHVEGARHRVIVVLDGPPDAESLAAVGLLDAAGLDLRVVKHSTALGFVISANRAMHGSDRDVVLLNSDTQVTAGWLDRLGAAAHTDPRIATVTPFSNNATICSLPRFLAENTVPAGYDIESFAAIVTHVSQREYPRLPTGVGACLYITRRALDEIGLFDEAFGLGYGEEIDFCRRASRRGYGHVLDDATYIFHEGSRSFGRSRQRRVARAERVLRARYPEFRRELAAFIRRDPLARARARVMGALAEVACFQTPGRGAEVGSVANVGWGAKVDDGAGAEVDAATDARARRRILHLVHGWPPWAYGGTEMFAYWLAQHQGWDRDVFVYARITDADRVLGDAIEHVDHRLRVRLIVNNFAQRNPLSRFGLHNGRIAADFRAFLDDVRPDLLHVHHLAGHCASLLAIARARGIPIVYQVHDWWTLCARANLFDRGQTLCSGPGPIKCARCLPMTRLPVVTMVNPMLSAARQRWIRRQVAKADAFVMGSRFIADSYRVSRVLPASASIHVLSYGVPERVPDAGCAGHGRARAHGGSADGDDVPARTSVGPPVGPPVGPSVGPLGNTPGGACGDSVSGAASDAARDVAGDAAGGMTSDDTCDVAGHAEGNLTGAAPDATCGHRGGGTSRAAPDAGTRGPLQFGYIGSLHPHKGVHVAIEAFAQIDPRRAQLHVWGDGDNPAYRARLTASARGAPAVLLHGPFPDADKPAILRSLDLLIVPSIGLESFGLAAREAMTYGVPVLASRRGALVELFDPAQDEGRKPDDLRPQAPRGGDFFEAGDAAALAEWVVRLVERPALIEEWRRALPAIKHIARYAEELDEIYAEVMKPHSR